MKAYQWLTLSAAVVITVFLHLFFTSAARTVSFNRNAGGGGDTRSRPGHCPSESDDGSRRPVAVRRNPVKTNHSRTWGAVAAVALLAALGGPSTAAAQESLCDVRLTVELTPDVPHASDDGFLSSLLNNHFAYRLELLRQDDSSIIEVALRGPGPEYRCQSVVEAMRKDARVESIHVEST
jgi:hypothetical protein